MTGKKLELPVKRIINGAPVSEVASRDALVDPAAIEPFVAYARERAEPRLTPLRGGATVAAGGGAFPRMRSAAFSAIMIVAAFVFARVIVGITEASTTRRPSTP